MNRREKIRAELVGKICRLGHPAEFGEMIADSLGTEKTMERMVSYLEKTGPQSPEQIADEMLAIVADRDRWVEKKKNEYYNQKYSQIRWTVLGMDGEES